MDDLCQIRTNSCMVYSYKVTILLQSYNPTYVSEYMLFHQPYITQYTLTSDLGSVSMNHSFSRAQSLLCSSQDSWVTLSMHRMQVIFFDFFVQLSLIMSQSQHANKPYIKAFPTISISIEHMNK